MEILKWLLEADRFFFEGINSGLSNPVFDVVMPLFRERLLWAPFYMFILAFTWFNFPKKLLPVLVGMIAVIAMADYTSSNIIKKTVQRIRPCNDPAMETVVVERVSCGSGYSFTSSHAANHFGAAVFLSMVFGGVDRRIRPCLLLWASLVAFAQVYVGVHYPLDVFMGALLGALFGYGIGYLLRHSGRLN